MRAIIIKDRTLANNFLRIKANNYKPPIDIDEKIETILESSALEGFSHPEDLTINWDNIKEMDILKAVSKLKQQSLEDLTSKKRDRELVYSRFLYTNFCLEELPITTLNGIGGEIKRDHATVLHYKKDLKKLRDLDSIHPTQKIKKQLEIIKQEFKLVTKILENECRTKNCQINSFS